MSKPISRRPVSKARSSHRLKSRDGPEIRTEIDETVCTAFISFALLLLRSGYARKDLAHLSDVVFAALPTLKPTRGKAVPRAITDAAHVLTLWATLSEYLINGRPRQLALRGPEPSVQGLLARVNPKGDLAAVVKHLMQSGAVKRTNRKYSLVQRWMKYRLTPYHGAHQLRHTVGHLLNMDHNNRFDVPTWFERAADCPRFPVSALPALGKYVNRQMQSFLENVDDYMHRRELAAGVGEQTVRVGVGGYQFQLGSERDQSAEFQQAYGRVLRLLKPAAAATLRDPDGGRRRT